LPKRGPLSLRGEIGKKIRGQKNGVPDVPGEETSRNEVKYLKTRVETPGRGTSKKKGRQHKKTNPNAATHEKGVLEKKGQNHFLG